VGALKYCHIKVTACTYAHRIRQPLPHAHSVILQLSGVTEIHCGSERRQVLPGELVLINDVRHLRIENLGPVEHLLLFNPLPQGHTEAAGALLHVRHAAQSPVARTAYRWIPDACSEVDWSDLDLGHSMEDCVARLLGGVFLEPPAPHVGAGPGQQGRLRHEDVLMHISHTLTDPDLSVASIAHALGCSTRTLHRLSRNAGGESIERSIRRLRIEKCAELLRTAQAGRITDLSLLYGFASPAHFSNAFRAVYGVSPSRYRLACAAVPVAQGAQALPLPPPPGAGAFFAPSIPVTTRA
jgi:AraC-like DNA-binding protein